MTCAQNKSARRKGNQYRRMFGPHPKGADTSRRRLQRLIDKMKMIQMRRGAKR